MILHYSEMDDRVQHATHWDGYGEHHKSAAKVAKIPGVMDGWHAFARLWTPDEYVFYVDGKQTWRTKAGGVCPRSGLVLRLNVFQAGRFILREDEDHVSFTESPSAAVGFDQLAVGRRAASTNGPLSVSLGSPAARLCG